MENISQLTLARVRRCLTNKNHDLRKRFNLVALAILKAKKVNGDEDMLLDAIFDDDRLAQMFLNSVMEASNITSEFELIRQYKL